MLFVFVGFGLWCSINKYWRWQTENGCLSDSTASIWLTGRCCVRKMPPCLPIWRGNTSFCVYLCCIPSESLFLVSACPQEASEGSCPVKVNTTGVREQRWRAGSHRSSQHADELRRKDGGGKHVFCCPPAWINSCLSLMWALCVERTTAFRVLPHLGMVPALWPRPSAKAAVIQHQGRVLHVESGRSGKG